MEMPATQQTSQIDRYMEQRKSIFNYLDKRNEGEEILQYRITLGEVLENTGADGEFNIKKMIQQWFREQARKKFNLNKGAHTSIAKERENDDSSEEATETTETNRQEESKTTEQGGDERKESKTETSE